MDEGLRKLAAPFVVPGPSGVAIRTRLRRLTAADEEVLRRVGAHLGALACRDLKARCHDGLGHDAQAWAARKRDLTPLSSARWAGAITKATHEQWALARRGALAHLQSLQAGVRMLRYRLALPLGQKGSKKAPGGYRSRREWHAKARRLQVLEDRLARERAAWEAGRVHVVRGGKRLARMRHQLPAARLTQAQWRARWEAARWFLRADGESGKRHGNETIRISPDGEVSLKLPAPLSNLANAPHGRYVLTGRIRFAHRGTEWADRVAANRAVAYRIHHDVQRGRWYVTASWQKPVSQPVPLAAALAGGVIGVDMNADHLAAWRLAPGRARQPDRHPAPLLLRPDRHRRPPRRPAPPRPDPPAALGPHLRGAGDRGGGPGLYDGEDPRETRPQQAVPAADLRPAHRPAPRPPRLDGRRDGPHRHRRGSGLHLEVGRPALAETPDQHHPQDHPTRCGEHRDRTTRPGASAPASDDTAPHPPE
ncbi:hypothetical protein OHB56_39190 [Streptomyces sp. NBC_01635]|nr:hypothetical protein OHB56_39190 [Streptomyces sp. NBC_01635]